MSWFNRWMIVLNACISLPLTQCTLRETIATTFELGMNKGQRMMFWNKAKTVTRETGDFCEIFMAIIRHTELGLERTIHFCNVKSHDEIDGISRTQLLVFFRQPYFRRNTLKAWEKFISHDFLALFLWWFHKTGDGHTRPPTVKTIDTQIRSMYIFQFEEQIQEYDSLCSHSTVCDESRIIQKVVDGVHSAVDRGNLSRALLSFKVQSIELSGRDLHIKAYLYFDYAQLIEGNLNFIRASMASHIQEIIRRDQPVNNGTGALSHIHIVDLKEDVAEEAASTALLCDDPVEVISFVTEYAGELYQEGVILRSLPITGIEELKKKIVDWLISAVNNPLGATLLRSVQVEQLHDRFHVVIPTVRIYLDSSTLAAAASQASTYSLGQYLETLFRRLHAENGIRYLHKLNNLTIVPHAICDQDFSGSLRSWNILSGADGGSVSVRPFMKGYFIVPFLFMWTT